MTAFTSNCRPSQATTPNNGSRHLLTSSQAKPTRTPRRSSMTTMFSQTTTATTSRQSQHRRSRSSRAGDVRTSIRSRSLRLPTPFLRCPPPTAATTCSRKSSVSRTSPKDLGGCEITRLAVRSTNPAPMSVKVKKSCTTSTVSIKDNLMRSRSHCEETTHRKCSTPRI